MLSMSVPHQALAQYDMKSGIVRICNRPESGAGLAVNLCGTNLSSLCTRYRDPGCAKKKINKILGTHWVVGQANPSQ